MGVIYKLKEEVVRFIISQRQSNPLASCRQLAESASQEFGLNLSKSSVHDVLKESGIITPRGRKPKDKFKIPQEKKKQIQDSLSQVKLLPDSVASSQAIPSGSPVIHQSPLVILSEAKDPNKINSIRDSSAAPQNDTEISPEYEEAGNIFLKAALWDLGIFSSENIKETDWNYYLTYAKGVKITLENKKDFFIDLPLPLERCIRETADGLINNVRPFIVDKISDEELFKACMSAQKGFKIDKISIVDGKDHILLEIGDILELNRDFMFKNIIFVENYEKNALERLKTLFLSQNIDNNEVMDNILNLKGFKATNRDENVVTLLINKGYDKNNLLQGAIEKLNGMYLRDEQGRLLSVKIQQ